ncbi:MAG: hypothetical protein R3F59_00570 [Myxococcota bacterium]
MRSIAWLLVAMGCTGGGKGTGDTAPDGLQWYLGCGDPVCNEYTGPFTGVPLCADEGIAVGTACTEDGATCDPVDDCNARVVCAAEDPTAQTGGCPISLRAYKHDVHYLSDGERQAAAAKALGVRLATWRYDGEVGPGKPHLGFVIDDDPASPAVQPDGRHVDVYGYASLAVAAVQEQQAQLDALQAQVAALRAELEAVRGTCGER